MKGKRKKRAVLNFTILSNDAGKVAKRFRIHRTVLSILFFLPIIPVLALVYYINVNLHQEATIDKLSASLQAETSKNENLKNTVASLQAETGQTEERLEELSDLEKQMRNYINELPTMVEPSGGLHILADKKDLEESSNGLTFVPSDELVERYKETLAVMDEVSGELQYTPTAWPTTPNVITSDFGGREDPIQHSGAFHTGVDIRNYYGTPVYATADGTVVMAKHYGSYGNAIKIRHSGTYLTLYGHLMQINVEVGDVVKKGDIIGKVGSTGRSTGPHLHYEVVKNGKPVDPKPYFNIYGEFDIE